MKPPRRDALALMLTLAAPLAWAADAPYPSRQLTYVVPYPPGGAADAFARQLAGKLGERLGQTVIVDNRPGANGNIAGELAYASAGNGNTMHLAGVQFAQQAGVELLHVPYKGGPPALNDVLGGQVPMMFNNLPAIVPLVKAGKLRAIAIATPQRSPLLPDVPTMEEAGLKGLVSTVWNGVFVRAGTPRAIVDRLNREITAVLDNSDVKRSLEAQGYDVIPSTPEQFGALIKTETPRWSAVVRASGATID